MGISPEVIEKIEEIAAAAYQRIGAENISKKIRLTVRFATSQPPMDIVLDGQQVTAIAVDIATVFSPEGCYHLYTDEHNVSGTVESVQALSIVILDRDVILCKSSYDVRPDPVSGLDQFINCQYRTTSVDLLTEPYIC